MKQTPIYIERLDWDSCNFKLKTGNVVIELPDNLNSLILGEIIEKILLTAEEEQYKLLYFRLPYDLHIPNPISSDRRILLVDIKVIYAKVFVEKPLNIIDKHIENYTSCQINKELLELAFESGKYSRFKLDPNFPSGIFEKIYSTWIDRSVKKEIADNVLIYRSEGEILGMLTYFVEADIATIGLIAVSQSHQGKNIGSILLLSMESILYGKVKMIQVATQKQNLKACSFYEKNQFLVKEETNIYHIWL